MNSSCFLYCLYFNPFLLQNPLKISHGYSGQSVQVSKLLSLKQQTLISHLALLKSLSPNSYPNLHPRQVLSCGYFSLCCSMHFLQYAPQHPISLIVIASYTPLFSQTTFSLLCSTNIAYSTSVRNNNEMQTDKFLFCHL
jgi:hypothetical protein